MGIGRKLTNWFLRRKKPRPETIPLLTRGASAAGTSGTFRRLGATWASNIAPKIGSKARKQFIQRKKTFIKNAKANPATKSGRMYATYKRGRKKWSSAIATAQKKRLGIEGRVDKFLGTPGLSHWLTDQIINWSLDYAEFVAWSSANEWGLTDQEINILTGILNNGTLTKQQQAQTIQEIFGVQLPELGLDPNDIPQGEGFEHASINEQKRFEDHILVERMKEIAKEEVAAKFYDVFAGISVNKIIDERIKDLREAFEQDIEDDLQEALGEEEEDTQEEEAGVVKDGIEKHTR